MKVKINDEYVLTSDAHNIILNRVAIIQEGKNKGKERLDAIGFYPSVVQACEGVLRQKGLRSTARTLKTLISEHHELLNHIRGLLPTLKQALKG